MSTEPKTTPPSWATRLLEWYCKPELLEDLEGDLYEYFERNLESVGKRRAKLIYVIDVFRFFRIYTVRRLEFVNLLINWIMLGSYIKTSGRNIIRNKLFSAINIVGLSISMSVGLLMIAVLSDIFSYDKFHANHSNIYRVISNHEYQNNVAQAFQSREGNFMASTSLSAASEIKENFPEPEAVAVIHQGFNGDLKVGEKAIPLKGYWANEDFFKVFSFKLVQGNPATALKSPFSILLTETSAKKLFDTSDVLGKTLVFNNDKQYTVTGVLKDVPTFSHIKFEMLGSLSTLELVSKDFKEEAAWDNVWGTWVYLLLPPNSDLKNLKRNLHQLSKKEDPTVKNVHVELDLQPMDKIMVSNNIGNQIGPTLGSAALWIFGGLAFVVLLSACFNYTNLSIARAFKRTREVGIRKVIGAQRSHVLSQFVVEAILISLCSLLVALFVFRFLRPYFLSIEPALQSIFTLKLSLTLLFYFLLFAVFIGFAAGLFPALFFARVNSVQVLKDFSAGIGFKNLTMRKVLIVFQYCVSIIFITSTLIMYKQYRHFVSFDLGFKTENILNIEMQGAKADLLKKELNELPEVTGISQSVMVTSVGNYWGTYMSKPTAPDDSAMVYFNAVDENYLPLHNHKLIAGRNFSARADSAETEIIVNQSVLKRFGLGEKNPVEALDEMVRVGEKDVRIVGVIKDFHYGRANGKIKEQEVIFRYSNKDAPLLNVKIESSDILSTYLKIESLWKKIDPVHPLAAKFYDEQIEETFSGLKATVRMAGSLAVMAIGIATIGLLGMVVFTTEIRVKEISIRKVLGASEAGLLFLLGKGFILLLVLSAAIGLPITYLLFDLILFPNIANHAPIAAIDLFIGAIAVLLLALAMICSQTLKATRTNPAQVLKSE
ncbi:MAG TPA: ABC transporter permease [Cyclobacteriaceae bacterium]|jgi:ABC-type antimicrobial peptide transport system permease subunit|nr:ABC transporter permease [Cyclobacteriaceae bacterium]